MDRWEQRPVDVIGEGLRPDLRWQCALDDAVWCAASVALPGVLLGRMQQAKTDTAVAEGARGLALELVAQGSIMRPRDRSPPLEGQIRPRMAHREPRCELPLPAVDLGLGGGPLDRVPPLVTHRHVDAAQQLDVPAPHGGDLRAVEDDRQVAGMQLLASPRRAVAPVPQLVARGRRRP
jgi:hypothetical protein